MCSVQIALLVRELKTRFGDTRLGYWWAVFEPATHVIVLSLMFGVRGRQFMPGIDFPIFVLTGLVAYDFVVKVATLSASAIEANQGLLVFKQVKPASVIVARVVMELLVHILAFFMLLVVGAAMGYRTMPYDPLGVLSVTILLTMFVMGMAFSLAVIGELMPESRKLIPISARFFYFTSCIIFPLALVPPAYRGWLTWNPLVHYIEIYRMSWFESFPPAGGSWYIAFCCSVGSCAIGSLLFQRYRKRLAAVV